MLLSLRLLLCLQQASFEEIRITNAMQLKKALPDDDDDDDGDDSPSNYHLIPKFALKRVGAYAHKYATVKALRRC